MAVQTYSGWIMLPKFGILGRADKATARELDAVLQRAWQFEQRFGVNLV